MPDADPNIGGEHLDADELNSYAENVLPAAARARYTEHLADCSSCRELIVQLSSAAGVITAERLVKTPAASWLRSFLASLFSPMVLRYAVPAVGLIVVAAIGFFVLNRESRLGDIAQSPQPAALASPSLQGRLDNRSDTLANQAGEKTAETPATPAQKTQQDARTAPGADQNAAAPVANAPADAKKEAAAEVREEPPPVVATAPANEPKPQPSPTDFVFQVEARKTERQSTDVAKAAKENTEKEKADDQPKEQARGVMKREARGAARTGAAAPAPAAGISTLQGGRDGADEKDVETRSVAGRIFRKQRGIWIDTAYSSGTFINVARGSEQYRALIADEPPLKTIADQLDGEIIVVWKGRIYRIR